MKIKLEKLGLSIPKVILSGIFCFLAFISIIYVALTSNKLFDYFYCIATIIFVLLPVFLTLIFKWKMNFVFYLFFTVYTFGPLLGALYKLYYLTSWWDDLLHFMAGCIFAVIGAQLALSLNKNQITSYKLAVAFGVLLSIGIAVVWEFYEFSSDMLLNSDMQADTIIDTINTKINRTDGSVDSYIGITETIVNGQSLGIVGYLDIGLIDTMMDLFVETLGALLFLVYAVFDRNNHPLIVKNTKLLEV